MRWKYGDFVSTLLLWASSNINLGEIQTHRDGQTMAMAIIEVFGVIIGVIIGVIGIIGV